MHKARLLLRPLRRVRSAELSRYESADPSTELLRFPGVFRLGEHPHERLRSGRADENPARAVKLCIEPLDLREQVVGERLRGNTYIVFRLGVARQYRRCFGEGATLERGAEKQRGGEAVAGDVVLQVDDVARLLAAEEPALPAKGLEHVAVADLGGDEPDPALLGKAVKPEVRHLRH